MDNTKFNVRALAGRKKISIEELAVNSGIKPAHLKSVSSGRATMTGADLIKLAIYTEVSPFAIDYTKN
jgi:hypothetical protein